MTISAILKYRVFDTKIGDVVLPIYLANASGSPVNGASGTLAGVAPPGALLLTQEVALYQNTNTQASPTWAPLTATAAQLAALLPPGTFTINGTSPVTVTDAAITANSQILITLKTVGGTVGAIPHVETITPGTGFTVVGTASDTSTYNYTVIG